MMSRGKGKTETKRRGKITRWSPLPANNIKYQIPLINS